MYPATRVLHRSCRNDGKLGFDTRHRTGKVPRTQNRSQSNGPVFLEQAIRGPEFCHTNLVTQSLRSSLTVGTGCRTADSRSSTNGF